ncbi:MAG: ribosome assembly factor SBDS [Candidatus Aenigmarchaeota archaeon]|nr:ribosome assembly factor SBDS [Candidatus Aenigmarchaeota archaeon]
MVTVDEAIIAKYDKDGKHFEILVDPDIAYDLKEGKTVSLSRMLAVNLIFTDAKKGLRAPASDIEKAFSTQDVEKIGESIVKQGDVQLTTEYRRKKTEEKKKQVASFISKYAMNPQTRVPHPQDRILAAMEQSRISIDPFKPAEQQVGDVVKALKQLMPISLEEIILDIHISAQYASRAFGMLKDIGSLQGSSWGNDGSLNAKILVPAGLKDSAYRRLGALTEGTVRITETKKE